MSSRDEVLEELAQTFRETAEAVVPSFLDTMPDEYFRDTDAATRLTHLRAIAGARASNLPLDLTIVGPDRDTWTIICEADHPGLLADLLARLPADRPLRSAKVHSAADGGLVLDVFRFGDAPRFDPADAELAAKRTRLLELAVARGEPTEPLAAHFDACSSEYLRSVYVDRIERHWFVCQRLWGTEDSIVELSRVPGQSQLRIDVATGGSSYRDLFLRIVRHLGRRSINIRRAYLDRFVRDGDAVAILGFVVDPDPQLEERWALLRDELQRLRWVDAATSRLSEEKGCPLVVAEVLVALTHLAHAKLAPEDRFAYARERLYGLLAKHWERVQPLAEAFVAAHRDGARTESEAPTPALESVDDDTAARFIETLVDATRHVLRTNLGEPDRYGLALRLDPKLMTPDGDVPFGVFFVHADGTDGFHVRFRDIARGGLRVVRGWGPEQHALESERLYEEAYGLAFAQQLKNKDIPEGGAKAVVLLAPGVDVEHGVKLFADGLLDLVVEPGRTIASEIERPESLYLGPDENISFALIEWIVDRAERRGHPSPNAFMSSKPGAGINHKQFGVTSEGVNVFLEEALRACGIDPRARAFTVKLTGGPDGDVAGNELVILHREYGDNAKVVGIADGSGCAEDPRGLDWPELLRLVERSAPIAELDPRTLGPEGAVVPVSCPGGAARRNSSCFRVEADAFVPAGGRPGTIHAGNWRRFLTEAGAPSSRVIVEGANLFFTTEARRALWEAGALIVKDSSANKCGVITSSFEILASMLLDSEAFLEVKPRFVQEVLERLRLLARKEARRLFAEHARRPDVPLPDLSVELSRTISRTKDAIFASLQRGGRSDSHRIDDIVDGYLPPSLRERAGSDAVARLPEAYVDGLVAATLATRMVYREGPDFLGDLEPERLAEVALRYLTAEREVAELAARVGALGVEGSDRIAELLLEGGPRAILEIDRGPDPRDG